MSDQGTFPDGYDPTPYPGNEAFPLIMNPDASREPVTGSRTFPAGLTCEVTSGVGSQQEFTVTQGNDTNTVGTQNQPVAYFHIQSTGTLAPGELAQVDLKGIDVYSPPDSQADRTGTFIVQHDAAANLFPNSGEGHIQVPLSNDPHKTFLSTGTQAVAPATNAPKGPPVEPKLLTYSLQGIPEKEGGNPQPIYAGKPNNIRLKITNGTAAAVSVVRVALYALVGTGEKSLCETAVYKSSTLPSTNFQLQNSYTEDDRDGQLKNKEFKPIIGITVKTGKTVALKPGDTLQIDLVGVNISRTAGYAELAVVEFTNRMVSNKNVLTYSIDTCLTVQKMGAGFSFGNFSSERTQVQAGQRGRLVWSADNVKEYALYKPGDDTTPTPAARAKNQDTMILEKRAAYALEAFAEDGLSHVMETVIDVANQSVKFHDVTVNGTLNLNKPDYTPPVVCKLDTNTPTRTQTIIQKAEKGDRHILVGFSSIDGYDPTGGDAGLTISVGNTQYPLYANPAKTTPVGLRLPPNTEVTITPNDAWNNWKGKATLKASLTASVSDPRLPPPPHR